MSRIDNVIADYLDELRRAVPANPTVVRTMVADAEAHLRDAAEEHIAEGMEPSAAAARAVAEFGPPEVVARSFLPPGVSLPGASRLTRWAARSGVVGWAALIAGIVLLNTSVAEVNHEPGPSDDIGWGLSVGLALAGGGLLLFSVVGLTVRVGRRLGRVGVLGNVVLLLAVPLSLPFGYSAPFVLIGLAAVGFTLLAVPAHRAGDLSRPAVGLVLAGPVIAAVVVALTEIFDGDASDYMILAVAPVVIGWAWMNISIAREPRHAVTASTRLTPA